jgi:hypothetical protein
MKVALISLIHARLESVSKDKYFAIQRVPNFIRTCSRDRRTCFSGAQRIGECFEQIYL